MSFEDKNKFGTTRVIDVCQKSDGRMALQSYDKKMNNNGEFNSMPIYLDEIKEIMEMLGYEK